MKDIVTIDTLPGALGKRHRNELGRGVVELMAIAPLSELPSAWKLQILLPTLQSDNRDTSHHHHHTKDLPRQQHFGDCQPCN